MSLALLMPLWWTAFAGPSVGEQLELGWSAPEGCPQTGEVRAAIDQYLGRDEFGDALSSVQISGRISAPTGAKPAKWRLDVEVRLPGGVVERAVEAARCEELAEAAGLMIAVALDPLRVSEVVEPREPPPALPQPEPPPPESPTRLGVGLRLGGAGQIGVLPTVGAGLWAAAALVGRRFRVELSGQYWFPANVRPFEDAPEAGARIQFGAGGVRACFVPTVRRFEFPSCLALEVGAVRAEGIGLATSRVSQRLWVAAAAGQELVWVSRRRVGVWLGLDAVVGLAQPSFVVDDLGTVLETGRVAFRFAGGPLLRF